MTADGTWIVLGEDIDELFANLLGKDRQVLLVELLDIGRRMDLVEKTHG
jgi:hypothetical protein